MIKDGYVRNIIDIFIVNLLRLTRQIIQKTVQEHKSIEFKDRGA